RGLLGQFVSKIDLLLSIITVFFLLQVWRWKWLRWRPAIVLALLLLIVGILDFLNGLPLEWHSYSTDQTLTAFWTSTLGYPLLILLVSTAWLILPFGAADAIGRWMPKSKYSLGEVPTSAFFHSTSFFEATVAGFATAGIHLGFVVAFYLL